MLQCFMGFITPAFDKDKEPIPTKSHPKQYIQSYMDRTIGPCLLLCVFCSQPLPIADFPSLGKGRKGYGLAIFAPWCRLQVVGTVNGWLVLMDSCEEAANEENVR